MALPAEPDPSKPYYITTPIFYVNSKPHIGHMYSMLLADTFKRWKLLQGKPALMLTGTDEHGIKVQTAAEAAGLSPREFCDQTSATFRDLADSTGIAYDRFMRTTDADHKEAVEHFWFMLRRKGLIYEAMHKGWYSVSDECFYPEAAVRRDKDPFTGEVFMAAAETGSRVEWVEEKNYHFRLSEFKEPLLRFYAENPQWITPGNRMNEAIAWVRDSIEDLSISRPLARQSWGIRVPDDPTQSVYVWVDALINYLTAAGYPSWQPGQEGAGGWPADVHVIGKDIVRFHGVYWPALLMALDLPLPRRILTHSHWLMNQKKMSKSLGNVVNPDYATARWGADAVRYYLLADGGIKRDASWSSEDLWHKYHKYLQSGVGNIVSRLMRTKVWSMGEIMAKARNGTLSDAPTEEARHDILGSRADSRVDELPEAFERQAVLLEQLVPAVARYMEDLDPNWALAEIRKAVLQTNAFLTELQPWELMRSWDKRERGVAERGLYMALDTMRIMGILLRAFLPEKAEVMLDMLGVAQDKRMLAHAVPGADLAFGVPAVDLGAGAYASLFPPLIDDETDPVKRKKKRQEMKASLR